MAHEGGHGGLGRLFAALVDGAGEPARGARQGGTTHAGAAGGRTTSALDVDALGRDLMASPDPLTRLRELVRDVRLREATGDPESAPVTGDLPPSPLELHLAGRLEEAGLMQQDLRLPAVRVVRPHTSEFFYLRIDEVELSFASKVVILRVEAALNAALIASKVLDDANAASEAELVRLEQRMARSIEAQAERVAQRVEGPVEGEWAVRHALSYGIEAFQLPHRLTARFRVNVREGVAAFECDLVSPCEWVQTAYVDGLGIVSASQVMRRRATSDYNLRLGLLLARYALLVAPELREVWVAGVVDTPRSHACYYSVRIERDLVEGLLDPTDPFALMASCGAVHVTEARTLEPVRQTFSLEDELFCPVWRSEPVETSTLCTDVRYVDVLGCEVIEDLGIDETAARAEAADELVRGLGDSTAANVRALLDLADRTGYEDVHDAALRVVGELIDGTLEDDPGAIVESLVEGDALSRKAERAQELLLEGRFDEAWDLALDALDSTDAEEEFADSEYLRWRAFGSYAERVLFNVFFTNPAGDVRYRLVPMGYLQAHVVACAAALADGRAEDALPHARRVAEVAPMSAESGLNLVQVLDAAERPDEAEEELRRVLTWAHDPTGVGLGYLSMAQLQWHKGNVLAAQACYQRASRRLPPEAAAGLSLVALLGQVGTQAGAGLGEREEAEALREAQVPVAPRKEVARAFMEATRAMVDLELFAPARSLMETLCSMSRDDVYFGMLRSLDGEPDR